MQTEQRIVKYLIAGTGDWLSKRWRTEVTINYSVRKAAKPQSPQVGGLVKQSHHARACKLGHLC